MIICSGCGHANGPGDAFCGSCGGFLEWDGEPVARRARRPRPALVEAAGAATRCGCRRPSTSGPRRCARTRSTSGRPTSTAAAAARATPPGGRSAAAAVRRWPTREPGERLVWWRRWWQALRSRFGRRRTFAAGERPDGWAKLHDASASGGSRKRQVVAAADADPAQPGQAGAAAGDPQPGRLRHRADPGGGDREGVRALPRCQPGGGAALRAGVGERSDRDQRAGASTTRRWRSTRTP